MNGTYCLPFSGGTGLGKLRVVIMLLFSFRIVHSFETKFILKEFGISVATKTRYFSHDKSKWILFGIVM